MPNRSFARYLHFHDFKILEPRKHSGCCGSEIAQALILNKIPGFAKPSYLSLHKLDLSGVLC
ncbi:MAG TPA: hypothetical protein VKA34_00525 [Balneolales bacterium]|nr:hypothetical protein [Balneolales bacterium]